MQNATNLPQALELQNAVYIASFEPVRDGDTASMMLIT